MKCLIADDTLAARELLRLILEELGLEVLEAADGEQALRLATKHCPDIIVIDLGVRKKSGFEVVYALRMQKAFWATPIVALTSAVAETQPSVIRQAGFSEFLVKPIRPATFRSVINGFISC